MAAPGFFDTTSTIGSAISSNVQRIVSATSETRKGLSHPQKTAIYVGVAAVIIGIAFLAVRVIPRHWEDTEENHRRVGSGISRTIDYAFIGIIAVILAMTLASQAWFAYKVIGRGQTFEQASMPTPKATDAPAAAEAAEEILSALSFDTL